MVEHIRLPQKLESKKNWSKQFSCVCMCARFHHYKAIRYTAIKYIAHNRNQPKNVIT